MRLISVTTKKELVAALAKRYAAGNREEKSRILDQFVSISGTHRKHAMRLLRGEDRQPQSRRRAQIYDAATREALIVLWEASDRICGKRLKPLLPILISSMEQHGHLKLDDQVRTLLLQMSAATIDRALKSARETAGGRRRRRSKRMAAADLIRSLVRDIILTPEDDELKIDVRGDLAGILAISLKSKRPAGGRADRKLRWLRGPAAI